MLPRENRLTRAEFIETAKKKKVFRSPGFLLSVTYHNEIKAAVVISKKISKNAVGRNKARRRIYAILEELFPSMKRKAYIVVVLKQDTFTSSFESLKKELTKLFIEAGLLDK